MINQKNSQRDHADDSKDTLVQMNIRVQKSVAQSFRSFCEERKLTQSKAITKVQKMVDKEISRFPR